MKFVKLSVFALLLLSVACTNDLNDSDSLVNQQEHVDSQYKAIFSTEKFECYELPITKTEQGELNQLIKVNDLPDIDIYFGNNTDTEYDDFPNKSIFYKNGEKLFVLYSEVIEMEDGFVLNLLKDTGEATTAFLPKVVTRSVGDGVAGCLVDAYSNHGWASVLLSVQSAFLPQTMAAACVIKNI